MFYINISFWNQDDPMTENLGLKFWTEDQYWAGGPRGPISPSAGVNHCHKTLLDVMNLYERNYYKKYLVPG